MSRIENLIANYSRHVRLPLPGNLASAQRVWFAVYPPEDERRLRARIDEFKLVTEQAGYAWDLIDLRDSLASWLQSVDRDELDNWFQHPEDIDLYAKSELKDSILGRIRDRMAAVSKPERTVFVLFGLLELFNYLHVSDLIAVLEHGFPGVLLAFFPGEREANTYRFLCARDGWNYMAVPILSDKELIV